MSGVPSERRTASLSPCFSIAHFDLPRAQVRVRGSVAGGDGDGFVLHLFVGAERTVERAAVVEAGGRDPDDFSAAAVELQFDAVAVRQQRPAE